MASDATGPTVSDERARNLISAPETATPREVARTFQEVIDRRTADGINNAVIDEQRREILRLQGRVDIMTKIVTGMPVEKVVANVKAAAIAGASNKTALDVDVERETVR